MEVNDMRHKYVSPCQLSRCVQSRIDEVDLKLAFDKLPADERSEGDQSGEQVRFINRGEARTLAPMMDRGTRLRGRVLRKFNPYRILIEVTEE
jgi:hypothetical protein